MRFKEFYLTEASKEYNYIKHFSNKIGKFLENFSKNFKKYSSYEKFGEYKIPIKEIAKEMNVEDSAILSKLRNGILLLGPGERNDPDSFPYFRMGKNNTAYGYYNSTKNLIAIPAMNYATKEPFVGWKIMEHFKSVILHELTHNLQNIENRSSSGTSNLSTEDWYKNKNEKEAIKNQFYEYVQKYVSRMFASMKEMRQSTEEEKKKGNYTSDFLDEYIKENNLLVDMFESIKSFIEHFPKIFKMISFENKSVYEKLKYFKTNHEKEFEWFLEETYRELKKEFKNVLPTKKLKYKDSK